MAEAALPGMEAGRRTETVEWGLRWVDDTILHRRGHVEPRQDEQAARSVVGRREYGWHGTEVVSRTIVTYTTRWEPS